MGFLTNRKIYFQDRDKAISQAIQDLDNDESFSFFHRNRLLFETTEIDLDLDKKASNHRILALNEVFVAERDVCKTSTF